MRNQKGFTLIELVVVIVILGILAAVAVPKFIDIQEEAKESAVNGARGAVASAMALAHAKSLIDDGGVNDSVDMDGATITMANRYPTADADGIGRAANLGTDFVLTTITGGVAITRAGESAGDNIYSFAYRAATTGATAVSAAVSPVVTGTTYTY